MCNSHALHLWFYHFGKGIKSNFLTALFVFLLIYDYHINKHTDIVITNLIYAWYVRQWN